MVDFYGINVGTYTGTRPMDVSWGWYMYFV